MSSLVCPVPSYDPANLLITESTCSVYSGKKSKKSYAKKPTKTGEWDRNEVVKFFTCNAMNHKYKIAWKYLIKFIETRTVQQVYNKIKISLGAIKYVNENFWCEYDVSDFPKVVDKIYEELFSEIKSKILVFLTANSQNIFHTKKQKINSTPKIQKHFFTFSEVEKNSQSQFWENICKNISIEIGNEDYFAFQSLTSKNEDNKILKIDEKSFMKFLLSKQ